MLGGVNALMAPNPRKSDGQLSVYRDLCADIYSGYRKTAFVCAAQTQVTNLALRNSSSNVARLIGLTK